MDSLDFHITKFLKVKSTTCPPTDSELNRILSSVEDLLLPMRADFPTGPPVFDLYRLLVRQRVNFSTSPGLPYSQFYPTNADFFGWNGFSFGPRLLETYADFIERWETLAHLPVMSPIHLFVKREPLKASKIGNKAYRLISSVGILDNLVAAWLYGKHQDAATSHVEGLPIKVGYSPVFGGYRSVLSAFPHGAMEADKSSWDWTMQGWVWHALGELLERLSDAPAPPQHKNHLAAMSKSLFQFDGVIYKQRFEGVMKSGYFLTLLYNSMAQLLLHHLASLRLSTTPGRLFSLGDDTLQEIVVAPEEYVSTIQKCGCIVKMVEIRESSEPYGFGGFWLSKNLVVPMYSSKHAFTLLFLSEENAEQTLAAYMEMYVDTPQFFLFRTLHSLYSATHHSRTFHRFRVHGFE